MWVCAALFPSCAGAVESAVESSDREALRLPDHSEAQQNQLLFWGKLSDRQKCSGSGGKGKSKGLGPVRV